MVLRSDEVLGNPSGSSSAEPSEHLSNTQHQQQFARPPFLAVATSSSLLLEEDGDLWDVYSKTIQFVHSLDRASLTSAERDQLTHLRKFTDSFEEKLHKLTQLRYDLEDIAEQKTISLQTHNRHSISPQDIECIKTERDRLLQRIPRDYLVAHQTAVRQSPSFDNIAPRQPPLPPPPGFLSLPQLVANSNNAVNANTARSISCDSWKCQACSYFNPLSSPQCQECGVPKGVAPEDELWVVAPPDYSSSQIS